MSETYTTGGDNWQPLTDFDILAQTFTPVESHSIDFIDLNLWIWGYTPPWLELRQCDSSHEPIGPRLTLGHIVEPLIYLPPAQRRVRYQLDIPIALIQGTIYSIWIYKGPDHIGPDNQVLYDKDDATYPRGHIIFSDDGGHIWTHFYGHDFIFTEFGTPPLPKPEPPPPISNFAAIDITQIPITDGVQIRLSTSVPCHLTLYWTDKKPLKHHRSRIIRGLEVPWATYFCFVAWHEFEQIEPGDSLYHTFNLTPWPICQTRWFSFRGEVDLKEVPSVGPIFKKHHLRELVILTLRPNAPGDMENWLAQSPPAGENWDKVCEIVPDEDATHVYMLTGTYWDNYNLPNHTIETGPIVSLKVTIRCRMASGFVNARPILKVAGTRYYGDLYVPNAAYSDHSHQWNTNPATGLPWTWADIDALQAGIYFSSGTGFARKRCTQLYVDVEYQILTE